MLYRLALPPLPTLRGERVLLRGSQESDIDDRLRHPIDPEEEDGYGSALRGEWDGRRYHTREDLTGDPGAPDPGTYNRAIEYDDECLGGARIVIVPVSIARPTRSVCSSPTYAAEVWVARSPGRPDALLRPAPLRTGRAALTASGSGKP
jgi:hypothetical protein